MSRPHRIVGCVALTSAALSLAVLVCVVTLGAGLVHAGERGKESDDDITKSFRFRTPACPIEAATVPATFAEFRLPKKNPFDVPVSVAGTVQVSDQTGSTVLLLDVTAGADATGVTFTRTVKALQHAIGFVAFDKGCTATDPYGSRNCFWPWRESVTAAYQGALQEDITAGKLIVDVTVNDTIPVQFSCPVCGSYCTFTAPKRIDDAKWDELWRLMIRMIRLPFNVIQAPHH